MATPDIDLPGIVDERPSGPSIPAPTRRNPPAKVEEDEGGFGLVDALDYVDDAMARVPWWVVLAGGVVVGWQIRKRMSRS